jgi:hypothetical protein
MDTETGRRLYKRIMSDARQASTDKGSTKLVPGTMREAARNLWELQDTALDFNEWWSTVHTLGLRPYPGSAKNGAVTHHVKMANSNDKHGTLIDRYRAVAMKHDILPLDEFIAEQWDCDVATPGRMRSKLKNEGFVFEKRNGVYAVISRPEHKPVPVQSVLPGVSDVDNRATMLLVSGIMERLAKIDAKIDLLIDAWK